MAAYDAQSVFDRVGYGRAFTNYAKGSVIYRQGSPADSVHYLGRGKVKLTVTSRKGKNAVIAILDGGAFFGESCIVDPPVRRATAEAMTDSSVYRWGREEMTTLLAAEPALSQLFSAHLLARVSRLEEDLVDHLLYSIEERLARALLHLASQSEKEGSRRIHPPVSHETLAEIVGTTRPRVTHFMSKFRRLGLITYNGDLEVHESLLEAVLTSP